jgi:hypothetical protein
LRFAVVAFREGKAMPQVQTDTPCQREKWSAHQESDPVLLAQQIIAELEELDQSLNDPSAHWLREMIDVLRVYVDHFPSVPNHMCTLHTTSGIILRRGLQSFTVNEQEFDQVRNAFRRCSRYRRKQRMGSLRREMVPQ